MCLSPRAVPCHDRLSLSDRNHESCFVSLINGILDLVDLLGIIHKTSLHVLNSYPNIILYDRSEILDHLILPLFLLGTFFCKVSFLITIEQLSCEMALFCSPFILCRNVLPSCHIRPYILLFPSNQDSYYVHSSIGDIPSRKNPLPEIGRPLKVVIYASACLTLCPVDSKIPLS